MNKHWSRMRIAAFVACAGLGIVVGPAAADVSEPANVPGDSPVPFWPHETGARFGTAETFVDMRADGSYYDASSGRRVFIAE